MYAFNKENVKSVLMGMVFTWERGVYQDVPCPTSYNASGEVVISHIPLVLEGLLLHPTNFNATTTIFDSGQAVL